MKIPIETLHLFPILDKKLIELLRSLSPEDWNKQTVAKLWTVKDVATHLLDGNLRTISNSRDNFFGESPEPGEEIVAFLNRLNSDWVQATKRLSPQVLIELLEITGKQFYRALLTLDPIDYSIFSVGWAGEEESENWFHIAREYTEKWHHQQQIRDAVNKPGILTEELYHPFLETFMRAMPYTYRNVEATKGTVVRVTITGTGGGDWFLIKDDQWQLSNMKIEQVNSHTVIDGNIAWKLFSKSWRRKDVLDYVKIEGDKKLGDVVLDMISVMA